MSAQAVKNPPGSRLAVVPPAERCTSCECRLTEADARVATKGLCASCDCHPAASPTPGEISEAERVMLISIGERLDSVSLLSVMNSRRVADGGRQAHLLTAADLERHRSRLNVKPAARGYAAMRSLLIDAASTGLLDKVTTDTIKDFAVIFRLSTAQVLALKDALLDTSDLYSQKGDA